MPGNRWADSVTKMFGINFAWSLLATFFSKIRFQLTVRLLEPGHLEEDCSIKTISENKKFSIFFAQTNKIKD